MRSINHNFLMGLALSLAFMMSCGNSETDQAANQQPAANQAPATASNQGNSGANQPMNPQQQMQKGMEAMAKGFQQMAQGTNPNGEPITPVDFRELEKLLPELKGWEKGKAKGQKMNMPVPFSQAEVTYSRGKAKIKAKIVDSTMNQMLISPFMMMLQSGFEKETDDGYEKSTKVAGNPGWEKWEGDRKKGQVTTVVANRFVVTFDGRGIEDNKALQELADAIDLKKLAEMK